jgi:ribokinase
LLNPITPTPQFGNVRLIALLIKILNGRQHMTRIAVVGSLNMDLIIQTPRLPSPGETVIGREFITAPGGKGANQAVAAARLGAHVELIGRVGADDFGRTLRETCTLANVNTKNVLIDDTAATGVAIIQVDDSGQNTIVVAAGANARVTSADVDAARTAITSSNALIVQLEVPLVTVEHALRLARAAHVLTVLNPAPAQHLAPAVLALADIIIPNESEATRLTGIAVNDWASAESAARALNHNNARAIIITLGARGALALANNRVIRVPSFPVHAIDATAAGDAFVAAFAVAFAAGQDLDRALHEANAAGALATTQLGAQPSLPTRAELDAFLRQESSR